MRDLLPFTVIQLSPHNSGAVQVLYPYLEFEMTVVCRADSTRTVARELVEHTLDLVGI
jgi:hypothetical protein